MKKEFFGPNIVKKIRNNVQRRTKKKDFFGQKNKLGLSLRTKKGLFGAKF